MGNGTPPSAAAVDSKMAQMEDSIKMISERNIASQDLESKIAELLENDEALQTSNESAQAQVEVLTKQLASHDAILMEHSDTLEVLDGVYQDNRAKRLEFEEFLARLGDDPRCYAFYCFIRSQMKGMLQSLTMLSSGLVAAEDTKATKTTKTLFSIVSTGLSFIGLGDTTALIGEAVQARQKQLAARAQEKLSDIVNREFKSKHEIAEYVARATTEKYWSRLSTLESRESAEQAAKQVSTAGVKHWSAEVASGKMGSSALDVELSTAMCCDEVAGKAFKGIEKTQKKKQKKKSSDQRGADRQAPGQSASTSQEIINQSARLSALEGKYTLRDAVLDINPASPSHYGSDSLDEMAIFCNFFCRLRQDIEDQLRLEGYDRPAVDMIDVEESEIDRVVESLSRGPPMSCGMKASEGKRLRQALVSLQALHTARKSKGAPMDEITIFCNSQNMHLDEIKCIEAESSLRRNGYKMPSVDMVGLSHVEVEAMVTKCVDKSDQKRFKKVVQELQKFAASRK